MTVIEVPPNCGCCLPCGGGCTVQEEYTLQSFGGWTTPTPTYCPGLCEAISGAKVVTHTNSASLFLDLTGPRSCGVWYLTEFVRVPPVPPQIVCSKYVIYLLWIVGAGPWIWKAAVVIDAGIWGYRGAYYQSESITNNCKNGFGDNGIALHKISDAPMACLSAQPGTIYVRP
jgi:hypothetical protein